MMQWVKSIIRKRPALWTFLHPRRAVKRYEDAIDCLVEAQRPRVSSADLWALGDTDLSRWIVSVDHGRDEKR